VLETLISYARAFQMARLRYNKNMEKCRGREKGIVTINPSSRFSHPKFPHTSKILLMLESANSNKHKEYDP
jgi:hypothetical protein